MNRLEIAFINVFSPYKVWNKGDVLYFETDNGCRYAIDFEIVEHIGVLTEKTKGWKREINLVSWGGAEPKIDIRDWSPDHSKMGKGISLTQEEVEKIKELL